MRNSAPSFSASASLIATGLSDVSDTFIATPRLKKLKSPKAGCLLNSNAVSAPPPASAPRVARHSSGSGAPASVSRRLQSGAKVGVRRPKIFPIAPARSKVLLGGGPSAGLSSLRARSVLSSWITAGNAASIILLSSSSVGGLGSPSTWANAPGARTSSDAANSVPIEILLLDMDGSSGSGWGATRHGAKVVSPSGSQPA